MSTKNNRIDEVELCIKMYPKGLQGYLLAFNDFNNALNKLGYNVNDNSSYQIKLQWWMNSLYDIVRGKKVGNDIADNFGIVAKHFGITVDMLYGYMNARSVICDTIPFNNLKEFEDYAINVGGTFGKVWAIISGNKENEEYFKNLGTAWTMVGLIRNMDFHDALGQQILPANMVKNDDSESAKEAVLTILTEAKKYLKVKQVSYSPYSLISTACHDYIKKFQKAGGDIKLVDVYNISRIARLKILLRVILRR